MSFEGILLAWLGIMFIVIVAYYAIGSILMSRWMEQHRRNVESDAEKGSDLQEYADDEARASAEFQDYVEKARNLEANIEAMKPTWPVLAEDQKAVDEIRRKLREDEGYVDEPHTKGEA